MSETKGPERKQDPQNCFHYTVSAPERDVVPKVFNLLIRDKGPESLSFLFLGLIRCRLHVRF